MTDANATQPAQQKQMTAEEFGQQAFVEDLVRQISESAVKAAQSAAGLRLAQAQLEGYKKAAEELLAAVKADDKDKIAEIIELLNPKE